MYELLESITAHTCTLLNISFQLACTNRLDYLFLPFREEEYSIQFTRVYELLESVTVHTLLNISWLTEEEG